MQTNKNINKKLKYLIVECPYMLTIIIKQIKMNKNNILQQTCIKCNITFDTFFKGKKPICGKCRIIPKIQTQEIKKPQIKKNKIINTQPTYYIDNAHICVSCGIKFLSKYKGHMSICKSCLQSGILIPNKSPLKPIKCDKCYCWSYTEEGCTECKFLEQNKTARKCKKCCCLYFTGEECPECQIMNHFHDENNNNNSMDEDSYETDLMIFLIGIDD